MAEGGSWRKGGRDRLPHVPEIVDDRTKIGGDDVRGGTSWKEGESFELGSEGFDEVKEGVIGGGRAAGDGEGS